MGLPWLLVALLAGAPLPAEPPPSSLSHRTFYRADQLAELDDATFEPEHWVDGNPSRLVFGKPGQLDLDWGQDGEHCAIPSARAADGGTGFELDLRCDSWNAHAQWAWVGPHRALTNLLDVRPADASPPAPVEVAERSPGQEVDTAKLMARFDKRYAAAQLPALVGGYRDGSGAVLVVRNDGAVTLDGKGFGAVVRRCSGNPCLFWAKTHLLRARTTAEGLVFEEGSVAAEIGYYHFEPLVGGRKFVRQP